MSPCGIVGSIVGLLVIGLAALLAQLLPVFDYPEPSGEYAVGTTALSLRDDTRNRDLMVQIWYPANDISNAKRAAYLPEVEKLAPALMATMGMPTFVFDHMRYIGSHSYENAPLAGGQAYPVLLFSHGLGGYRHQSVMQMEQLASHGYIVVSIDHTNYASAVVFPDGSIKSFAAEDEDDMTMREAWKADQQFVFNQIALFNESNPLLKGSFDLTRVGAFGHSFGGSTLTFFCENEPRCLASVNMDGSMPTTDNQPTWQKPFAYLMSDDQFSSQPEPTDDQLLQSGMTREEYNRIRTTFVQNYQRNYGLKGEQGYWLHLEGTKHQNFSDVPFASPLFAAMGATGSIAPTRGNQIINDYLLAFFGTYVKGANSCEFALKKFIQ
jgi:dienelactone hydrolase